MADEDDDQLARFQAAARELETDDDEARFNERLRKLAKTKPERKDGDEADN
jgi:hypothetical protein